VTGSGRRAAIRIGVIGAGAMGSVHASAWARIEGAELAGIAARSGVRVKALAARLGVPAHTDPAVILDDPDIDAVDVTVPTRLHRDFVVRALERGKHVLCETPLAPGVAEAETMLAAAHASGRLLQVALLQRLADSSMRVRDLVRSGELGRPRAVSTQRLWPGASQAASHHGDALEELALFDIDLLLWALGAPRAVMARAARDARGGADHVHCWLEFDGLTAHVEASRVLPASFPFRIAGLALFERGALEWRLDFPDPEGIPSVRLTRYPSEGRPVEIPPLAQDPYEAECRHFLHVVRGEADPSLLDARAALAGLRVIDAARASLASGAPVPLDARDPAGLVRAN
jgi:predicted dehydrogenase